MNQKARNIFAYTENGMRQCDLKIGPRLSRFSNGPVRRKAVDGLYARRREFYFEELRYQISNAWTAVWFLQSEVKLTPAEIARVFNTSERKVLTWFYLADTARGRHVAMCNRVKTMSEIAIIMQCRRAVGRTAAVGATLREWFELPNDCLGGHTPLESLLAQELKSVESAMWQATQQ